MAGSVQTAASGEPSIQVVSGEEFVARLRIDLPAEESFTAIGDLTALRRASDGEHYRSNYLRGILLYALVAARRPAAVVEFGTGRGYGALCTARALVEHGLPGRVYTIDVVPHDQPFAWTYRDERGPRTEEWSRADFWRRHFPKMWVERIVSLVGPSSAVVRSWSQRGLPDVELAFVDGGHDYATVRHDLLASFGLAGPRIGLLLDDFVERPGFGVVRAVRELCVGRLPVTLVPTQWGPIGGPGAGMVWVDGDADQGERDRLRSVARGEPVRGGSGLLRLVDQLRRWR